MTVPDSDVATITSPGFINSPGAGVVIAEGLRKLMMHHATTTVNATKTKP